MQYVFLISFPAWYTFSLLIEALNSCCEMETYGFII